jgi:hypothetical protein
VCCDSILYIIVFVFILYFFIKLFYIFLKFQDVFLAKSKIQTILTVLFITVNIRKGSMTKSLSWQYEKVYIVASAFGWSFEDLTYL